MSRWEIDLRYERKLDDSDRRYFEVISIAHPQVGYLRHREAEGFLVVTVETDAETGQQAVAQAMDQSRQLWVNSKPLGADVAPSS